MKHHLKKRSIHFQESFTNIQKNELHANQTFKASEDGLEERNKKTHRIYNILEESFLWAYKLKSLTTCCLRYKEQKSQTKRKESCM